ncbi:MAG: iron hydrogenase small subunit [Bacilli bacterium]|nr:iron hydrogenase small subunit [Bacilli bacterium]
MKDTVNIKINGIPYEVEKNLTILEASRICGYDIPILCHWDHDYCAVGSCRVCLVGIKEGNNTRLVSSCSTTIFDGIDIDLLSPLVLRARKTSVELLLSNHSKECQQCPKNGNCELLNVAKIVGADENKFSGKTQDRVIDISNGITRDSSKCVLCGRCVEVCNKQQGIGVLSFKNKAFENVVSPTKDLLKDSGCIFCGQCVLACPTGALMENSSIKLVDEAFEKKKKVIVQVAPAIRAAIAEAFEQKIGVLGAGKMFSALKKLGFYRVFDTNFGADLTITEEAEELVERIKNKKVLPQITSCCPAWINYMERFYADLIPNISSCKSPHQMEGAIIKSYFAQKHNLMPDDIFVVSVMPCTAKKDEIKRKENKTADFVDVDAVLTTREIIFMIKRAGINWSLLPDGEPDNDLIGEYSGAGAIFGVSGGVMEAALRTAYFKLVKKEADILFFKDVRGLQCVREATINIGEKDIKVAVVSGIKNAVPLLQDVRNKKSPYTFIEIMACPGGCINGGGQPYVKECFFLDKNVRNTYIEKRSSILYNVDEKKKIRQSHNNEDIKKLYNDFLIKPCSELSHKLLHTTYSKKDKFSQ